MGLVKRTYTDRETVITAENLNEIQDAIIALEDGLFSVDNDKSGAVITITDAAKRGFRSLNIFGKTTQNGTPTPDAPVDLVSAGRSGQIAVEVFKENVLRVTATSKTVNGVTFTINADKSITVNGTATEQTVFTVSALEFPFQSDFILSGCPKGGSGSTYSLVAAYHDVTSSAWVTEEYDIGNGLVIKGDATRKTKVSILIRKGVVASNLVFYPMLRPATVSDATYEQCVSQSMTISTPTGLPGIPVTTGGNYTDANGQQWVCDEIDFARGVRIIRIAMETVRVARAFSETPDWAGRFVCGSFMSSNCKSGTAVAISNFAKWKTWGTTGIQGEECFAMSGKNLYYTPSTPMTADEVSTMFAEMIASDTPPVIAAQLEAPIETPLTEEELAAYAALHTYKDHTTVSNSGHAYMELEYVMDAKKYIDSLIGSAGGGASAGIHNATVE